MQCSACTYITNPLQRGIDLYAAKVSKPSIGCAEGLKTFDLLCSQACNGFDCFRCYSSCQSSILNRMRGNTDDDDSPETPLLGDNDAVVTIVNSDNESPTTRSARRSKSTSDRIRNRNPSLLGARRTPSNLFKNSNDPDTQNEVSRRSVSTSPASTTDPHWSNSTPPKVDACYPQLELIVLTT